MTDVLKWRDAQEAFWRSHIERRGSMLIANTARVGTRVRTRRNFSGVPAGMEGVIDQDYGTGVMVAWDLPDRPLPTAYRAYDGRPAFATGILRDGFDKHTELHFLEVVR